MGDLDSPLEKLEEPLIPIDDESDGSGGGDDDDDDLSMLSEPESKTMSKGEIAVAAAAALLVTAGAVTSAAAMMAAQSIIVYVAGGICVLNSPVVALKQYQISKNHGIRSHVNSLRVDASRLQKENELLSESVDDLAAEVDVLHSCEEELRGIVGDQGDNVNKFIATVKENEDILGKMKNNLRQYFAVSMAKFLIGADRNNDMKVDMRDAPILALQLKIHLEAHGIVLDTDKFESMLSQNNNISHVLKFCSHILFEEEKEKDEEIEDEIDSADYRELSTVKEEELDMDDMVNMFEVQDKYTRGSVAVARGTRMTLMNAPVSCNRRRTTVLKKARRKLTVHRLSRSAFGDASRTLQS